MKRINLILICLLFAGACTGNKTSSVLDDVESYIQESPDSALQVLGSISKEDLYTQKLKAKYSLLYTMTLDKNYIDTTNLDVILPASVYYSKHGSLAEKMKAFFYHGCIYANRGEDDQAVYYYMRSLEDSSIVQDNHYKELINSALSDIFSRNYNGDQELYYSQEALKYGYRAKDSVGIWAITGHIASCYANIRKFKESMATYDDFFNMPVYNSYTYALVSTKKS